MHTFRVALKHKLFFSWTGWPSESGPPAFPPQLPPSAMASLTRAWTADGLTPISHRCTPGQIQFTVEAEPDRSPTFITARIKGRLQHALRQEGTPASFSRKVSLRSLGENTADIVRSYLALQTSRSSLADPQYRQLLEHASFENADVDLSEPVATRSGRYWYNLHLVLVTSDRFRIGREDFLPRIQPAIREAGSAYRLKALAIMPDHVHLAVGAGPEDSPEEVTDHFSRALNQAAGCRLFGENRYAGTFSEYAVSLLRST